MNEALYWALEQLLKPAGGGVFVVSTGLKEQQALQKEIYQAEHEQEIDRLWKQALRRIPHTPYCLMGIPSDTGAGFTRGSNLAPMLLRKAMPAAHPMRQTQLCVDIGDVRVVPQLLSDEMLSQAQKDESHLALYGQLAFENHALFNALSVALDQYQQSHLLESPFQFPVSPLSITQLVYQILFILSPQSIPIALGGDHSVAWPTFKQCFDRSQALGQRLGLLHFDAHTDLLEKRLGIKYCFATWAYHANECFQRDGRLVQVGVRASGKTQEYWLTQLNVRQYWPHEFINRPAQAIADEIIQHFQELGVTHLYVSNDIDGTDMRFASATGTPEGNGLTPQQVRDITQALIQAFPLVGADLVEVAPPLEKNSELPNQTIQLSIQYLEDFIKVI